MTNTPGPFYITGEHPRLFIREMVTDYVLATIEDGMHTDDSTQLIDDKTMEANAILFAAAPKTAIECDRLNGANAKLFDALADCITQMEQCKKIFPDDEKFAKALKNAQDATGQMP